MRKLIKITSLSIILLLLTGMLACRKDKPTPCNDPECYDFPNFSGITWFTSDRYQYKSPCFNPNNSNEFIYNLIDRELKTFKLLKYNLLTGERVELVDQVNIISQPKWSRKGWITFDNAYGASNYQISIIKDNGDSLSQFTSVKANLYPTWDATGEHLYWQYSPVLGFPYFFLKQGLLDTFPDTILRYGDFSNGYVQHSDITSTNKLASEIKINEESHLAISENTNSISYTPVINLDQEGLVGLLGLCWSSDNETIYFSSLGDDVAGLYRLNSIDQSKKRLIKFCSSKRYTTISCSPDGTKLIGERVDQRLNPTPDGKPTGEIQINSSIYLIDLETLKETKINLE